MNRTIALQAKKDKQQVRPRPIFAYDSKVEMRNHNKNINKLIFYQSDEEHSNEEENNHDKLYQTTREIIKTSVDTRNKKQQFKAETLMLKPSIMKFNLEGETDYFDFMPNNLKQNAAKQNNFVASAVPATKKDEISIADLNKQTKKQPQKQQMQLLIFQEEIELPVPPKMEDQKKQSKLSKIVPSTLYFQDSEEEEKPQEKEEKQSNRNSNSNSNRVDTESVVNEVATTQNQQETTQQQSEQQKIQAINILQIDLQVIKRSSYFAQIIKDSKRYEAISSLMFQPLRPGTRHIFQVHVSNSILQKTFQFWLDCHPTMKLLMKAKKITKLHRTEYQITTYFEGCQQFCQTCTIVSNIQRSQFNIEKVMELGKWLLGTISCSVTLQSNKNLVLYFPTNDPNSLIPKRYYQDNEYTTLKQVYQLKQSHFISYLLTTKLKIQQKLELMRDFKFKVSEKSMQFRNKQGELQLIIGKKASKTYTLIAGPGLTPVQLFSLAIINIETY